MLCALTRYTKRFLAQMAVWKTLLFLFLITEKGYTEVRFPIAGLFNRESLEQSRQAFENIVVTSSSSRSRSYNGRLFYPSVLDSYSTSLEVCRNTSNAKGIVGLIDGRPTKGYCDITCLLCNKLNIFHLAIGWELSETIQKDLFTFAYHPPAALISKAYAKLIADLDWDKFTIFYEKDESFVRLQELIGTWPTSKQPITFRKLHPGDNREIFKDVINVRHLHHHVIDCENENLISYMQQILEVVNSIQYENFILTNLDSYNVNFKEVPDFIANVSTLYLTKPPVKWWNLGLNETTAREGVKLETALAVDALDHFEKAVNILLHSQTGEEGEDELVMTFMDYEIPSLCYRDSKEAQAPWGLGERLREIMLSTQHEGYTSNIEFDKYGQRKNVVLYYSKLNSNNELEHVGIWHSEKETYEIEKTTPKTVIIPKDGTVKIRVISRNNLPYFNSMVNENNEVITEGYAVDLATKIFEHLNETQKDLKFFVSFRVVDTYGNFDEKTKKWDGIIGELMEHKADMGILDLSITSERNNVVDFSTPFMTTGISILFRVRDPVPTDLFSFINPLALDVWLYLATAYIVVSYILLVCARMSQDDWVNPHPCNQNPENLQNIWSLYNCMWLTMGSIMTQGCDILPRGLGSRWVTGVWYFFAMIVTASYTANMSTFLSNSRRTNDIKDVKELADQTAISYGAVKDGSTYKFFKYSNDSVYQKIWQNMVTAQPEVFTKDNAEGKDRVLKSKGNYAFFMESTAIKYYTAQHCKLRMVGAPLDSKAYGIAMPKNFAYKRLVDTAILKLQEDGTLNKLKEDWWQKFNPRVNDSECEGYKEEDDSGSLQMQNTGGIFLVLGTGGILGLIVAVIDFMLHARSIAVKEKVTFREALASEWRASMNPKALSKPALPPRSAPASTRSSSTSRHERSHSRAVSVLRAATSFINFDEIY